MRLDDDQPFSELILACMRRTDPFQAPPHSLKSWDLAGQRQVSIQRINHEIHEGHEKKRVIQGVLISRPL